jgi:hypothetical protein
LAFDSLVYQVRGVLRQDASLSRDAATAGAANAVEKTDLLHPLKVRTLSNGLCFAESLLV